MRSLALAFLALAAFVPSALAKPEAKLAIVVAVPETGPDVQVAAYVLIANTGEAERLIGFSCACSDKGEIHNTFNREMHTLPSLDVPANGALEIKPGGPTHLMLMGLKTPIKVGQMVPMTLTFEKAGAIDVKFLGVTKSRDAWAALSER